jgi:serine/threonine protein kinase
MAQTFHRYRAGDKPVGGYKLIRKLGEGGFGEVWQASAPGGAEVALKFIDLTGQQGFREFKSLRLVKKITHNNLTPLHGFWLKTEDGTLIDESDSTWSQAAPTFPVDSSSQSDKSLATAVFTQPVELIVAMGLGKQSLYDRLRDCQQEGLAGIPADELLDYMRDAAKGIDYLNKPRHDLGNGLVPIVHSDIKPHNILIVGDGAQVCDFGLAQAVESLRKTCAAPLTLAYAAPESFRGKPCDKSDQYSLAITYIELRTGCLPFDDSLTGYEVMTAHVQGQLDFSRLTAGEAAVIRRATALLPQDRWETSRQMVEELRRSLRLSSDSGFAPDLGTSGEMPLPPALPGIVTTPTAGLTMMPPGMPTRETSVHAGLTPSDVDPALKTRTPGVAPIIVPAPPQVEPEAPRRRMSTGAKLLVSLVLLGLVGGAGAFIGFRNDPLISKKNENNNNQRTDDTEDSTDDEEQRRQKEAELEAKKEAERVEAQKRKIAKEKEDKRKADDARKQEEARNQPKLAFEQRLKDEEYSDALNVLRNSNVFSPTELSDNLRRLQVAWVAHADKAFSAGQYDVSAADYEGLTNSTEFGAVQGIDDLRLMHARAHLGTGDFASAKSMLDKLSTLPATPAKPRDQIYFLVKLIAEANIGDDVDRINELYTAWKQHASTTPPASVTANERARWMATQDEINQLKDARDSIVERSLEAADGRRKELAWLDQLAKIVEMDPKNVDAWLAKADAHLEHDQLADAAAAMQTRKALGGAPKLLSIERRAAVLDAYYELTDQTTNDARITELLNGVPILLGRSAFQDRRMALATAVSQLADSRTKFLSQAVDKLRAQAEPSAAPRELKTIFANLLKREIPQRLARTADFHNAADDLLQDCRFITELASNPDDVPEVIRACHAECLLELEFPNAAAALGASGETPYYHYVRARVFSGPSGNRPDVDNSLKLLFAKSPPPVMALADRTKRAIALVDGVARDVRGSAANPSIEQLLTSPVGDDQTARDAFKLLLDAYRWTEPTLLSSESRAHLAIAARWMKGSAEQELSRKLSEEVVRDWLENKSDETLNPSLVFSLYHTFLDAHKNVNQEEIDKLRIESAQRLIHLCSSTARELEPRDAAKFYENIVEPVEPLAKAHGVHKFFAEAAALVAKYKRYDWKFSAPENQSVSVPEKLDILYTAAIDASGAKEGEYFKRRANNRLLRQPLNHEQILADSEELKKFDGFKAQGHALEGYIRYLQSREVAASSLADRVEKLRLAFEALEYADKLATESASISNEDKGEVLYYLSMVHLERGNFAHSAPKGAEISPEAAFRRAIECAQKAIEIGGGPNLQFAYLAAANAYEDLASIARVEPTTNFFEAQKQIRNAIASDGKSPDAHLALARCYYKMVENRVNPPQLNTSFAGLLVGAREALNETIKLAGDEKHPEAHLWLARVIQASHLSSGTNQLSVEGYNEADEQFRKAYEAAQNAKLPYVATYALWRAEHSLLNPALKSTDQAAKTAAIMNVHSRAKQLEDLHERKTVALDAVQKARILRARADLNQKSPPQVLTSAELENEAARLSKVDARALTASDASLLEFRLGLFARLQPNQLTAELIAAAVRDALSFSQVPIAAGPADRVSPLATAMRLSRQMVDKDKSQSTIAGNQRLNCLERILVVPVQDNIALHRVVLAEFVRALSDSKDQPAVVLKLHAAGKSYVDRAIQSAKANKRPATELAELNKYWSDLNRQQ